MAARSKQTTFSLMEKTFIVTTYNSMPSRENIINRVQHAFHKEFPQQKIPNKATIYRHVNKFFEHGTLDNMKKGRCGRRFTVRTEENKARVLELVIRKSRPTIIVNTGNRNEMNMKRSSWFRTLKDLNLNCYR